MEREDPEVLKPFESPSEENEHHGVKSPDLRLQPDDRSQPEEDDDCFYDCTESLETPEEKGRGWEKEDTSDQTGNFRSSKNAKQANGKTDEVSVLQCSVKGPEDTNGHMESVEEPLLDSPDQTEELREETGNKEDERWDEMGEDTQAADADSDTEIKVKEEEVEFDDERLREVEESLTEEQREARRQESLALKEEGNKHFKSGQHQDAERSYTSALGVCPVCYGNERAVLFSNRAAARLHLDLKEKAIADCSKAIELHPDYVKAILRRAELYEKTDKLDEALDDFKKVLEKDPGHQGARQACMRLPRQIEERNEKLKEEMMSKLKDLGNMFLRPFGLSTNNFQLNQDTNTGSYSVNFVQNPSGNNR